MPAVLVGLAELLQRYPALTVLSGAGQTVSAVLAGLAELKDGLRQAAARLDSVEAALGSADGEMATTRADITAVQVRQAIIRDPGLTRARLLGAMISENTGLILVSLQISFDNLVQCTVGCVIPILFSRS